MAHPPLPKATLAFALLGMATVFVPAPGTAQNYETGGIQLTFGVGLQLDADDNRKLTPVSAGTSQQSAIPLSFGILSETRASRFALDLGAVLRAGDTSNEGLQAPSAGLSYERDSADARFALGASLRETDLAQGSILSDDGLEVIKGTATRRTTSLNSSLNWRDDAPLGFGLSAQVSEISYRGGTATDLDGTALSDSRRVTLRASARADLSAAARLDMGLGWTDYDTTGTVSDRRVLSFDSTLTLDRPLGAVIAGLTITETSADPRITANIGRSLAFPLGEVTGRIGVTRGAQGDVFATGALDLRHDLPLGTINIGVVRTVADSEDTDSQRLSTRVNMAYLQDLSPLSNMRLSLSLAQVEDTSSGATARIGTLDAVYSRQQTEDWNLNLGYRHRYNRDDGAAAARSNSVFLEMRRDFVTRF